MEKIKNPLDKITPLMSITAYNAKPVSGYPNSDVSVSVEYYRGKLFKGIVTASQWKDFFDRYTRCEKLFWEM